MKKIFLFTAIVISLIAQSCSKSTDDLTTSNFDIEEAQAVFVSNFNHVLSTKSADETYNSLAGGDYTPIWDMAKFNENEYIWSLEVPIMSDLQVVLKNNTTDVITGADRRLLFIKSKETQVVSSFIMISTTAETKSSSSNYEHLADNKEYSGYVLYSTMSGELVQLNNYENGLVVASLNSMEFHNSHNSSIEHIMGCNTFGFMTRAHIGNGEYLEGFCVGCGTEYPYCTCGETSICPLCNYFIINCKCGSEKDEYALCNDCGNYHMAGYCKYLCPICGKNSSDCRCK